MPLFHPTLCMQTSAHFSPAICPDDMGSQEISLSDYITNVNRCPESPIPCPKQPVSLPRPNYPPSPGPRPRPGPIYPPPDVPTPPDSPRYRNVDAAHIAFFGSPGFNGSELYFTTCPWPHFDDGQGSPMSWPDPPTPPPYPNPGPINPPPDVPTPPEYRNCHDMWENGQGY